MESRALIIGPWNYEDSRIPSHSEIRNSASKYLEVLADDPKWGTDRVRSVPPESLSSVNDVMDAVRQAADETTEGGTLLVIYVGHGTIWKDTPGHVHFAVESSREHSERKPWTWLSYRHVYGAMRRSRATLKVMIADCCYSKVLPSLGGGYGDWPLPGALGEEDEGTCVLVASKNNDKVHSEGCPQLPYEDLWECTPFSGHLLSILRRGTKDHNDVLTIGMIREELRRDITRRCMHDKPDIRLSGAREGTPLFTNRMQAEKRDKPSVPDTPEEWAETLKSDSDFGLEPLLRDPRKTGKVYALLSRDADSQHIASKVDQSADRHFREQPLLFARYWDEARQASPA